MPINMFQQDNSVTKSEPRQTEHEFLMDTDKDYRRNYLFNAQDRPLEDRSLDMLPLGTLPAKTVRAAGVLDKAAHRALLKTPTYLFDKQTYKSVFNAPTKPKLVPVNENQMGAFRPSTGEVMVNKIPDPYIRTNVFGHEMQHAGDARALLPSGSNPTGMQILLGVDSRNPALIARRSKQAVIKGESLYYGNLGERAANKAGMDRMMNKLEKDYKAGNITKEQYDKGRIAGPAVMATPNGIANTLTVDGLANKRAMLSMFRADKGRNAEYAPTMDDWGTFIGKGALYGEGAKFIESGADATANYMFDLNSTKGK